MDVLLQESSGKVTIFDQGIIQGVWSYAYLTNNDNYTPLISTSFNIIPSSYDYVAIYVTAPPEELKNRLKSRSGGVEPAELSQDISSLYNIGRQFDNIYRICKSEIHHYQNINLIRVENSGGITPEKSADEIKTWILNNVF
ncbi:hypothetical protein ACOZ32_05190 [Halobacterium sp. MBLA0001]|uniref:hypothetical protein n=1 Tax=Halobacterium sp. MBLA0001 TaxID=3413511 RepID=UPI003C74876B